MNGELTVKEMLKIMGDICNANPGITRCQSCPFKKREKYLCHFESMRLNTDEVIKICKKWKSEHEQIEVEWVHVYKIIEDTGNSKRCVYEKEIDKDEIFPFALCDSAAEEILKEYCKNHEGNFFATVERICRKAVR